MTKVFFQIYIYLFTSLCFSQSSYFGSTKGVELNLSVIPSLTNKHTYDEANNQMVLKPRLAHYDLSLNLFFYNKLNKELIIGVNYSNFRMHSEGQLVNVISQEGEIPVPGGSPKPYTSRYNIIEDPRANYIGINIQRRYYTSGVAPLGFYLGWSMHFGRAILTQNEFLLGDAYGTVGEGSDPDRYDLDNLETFSYKTAQKSSASSQTFGFEFGETICLTNRLILNFGASIPIFSFASNLRDGAGQYNINRVLFKYDWETPTVDFEKNYWSIPLAYSLNKKNLIGFRFGLKWHI